MNYDCTQIMKQLQNEQKASRFMHTLGVAYTCANLAMRYDVDIVKAYTAGLLHDCAKHLSSEALLELCINHNIDISETQKAMPYLLHGKAGVIRAKEVFGINDVDILSSIEWHTTGRPNMSMLEKIVFVADYIEPHRDQAPNLKMLRKQSYIDIDKTVAFISKQILDYLQGQVIDEMTLETYNFYKL